MIDNPWVKKLLVVVVLAFVIPAHADSVPPPPTLKVLTAGKDPKPLRLTPKVGAKRTIVSTTKESKGRGLAGKIGPMVPGPAIRSTLDVAIVESSADQFKSEVIYRKPEVIGDTSQVPKEVLDLFAGLDGVKSSIVTTNRGIVTDIKVTGGTGATAAHFQMVQSITQQVFSAYPDEAIGVGGKWTTTATVGAGEMTVKVETTYELVERAGTKIKLQATVKGDGKGSGPGNLTVKLTGKASIETDLVMGIATRVNYQMRTEVGLDANGQRLGQVQESVTEVR